jgi:hypothetical protein
MTPSDAHVRALAEEILRRGEYANWRSMQWLERALAWLSQLSENRPPLYWVLLAVLLLLALVLIAHVTIAVRAALAVPPPATPEPPGATGVEFVVEAEALAASGRFLEAARRLQLAVIQLLLRRRVVTLARSESNRILRARLRDAPLTEADRRDLVALVDRFERSWFRDRAGDRALYEAWRGLHERLAGVRAA